MRVGAAQAAWLLLAVLGLAAAQPNGYYNVAPPGMAPVPVATGNDYAPTPAGDAIILLTDVVLRLNTSTQFAGTSQTNFATALRSLLAPFSFMSVAVSGFQEGPQGSNYVDVTTRIVDFPSDAYTLAGIWQQIGQQLVVNKTLLPSLDSLLSALNVSQGAQLLSLQGENDPTQPLATMEVNFTVPQSQAAFQGTSLTQPLAAFLGDHAKNVTLASVTPQGANQVLASVGLVVQSTQLPQLFVFLQNSSSFATNGVTPAYSGYQVLTELAAPAIPSPPPAPPAKSPLAAPPPQASATTAPQQTSASNPTVTMDVYMRIFGSSVVPFTATNQFVAASALAGVFSIVLGVGSVQIVSSTPATPGALPSTSAASGARKLLSLPEPSLLPEVHVRQLLQAAAPASGAAPAVDVVFAVSLPTASQNSLLVVQSTSPVVRAQFAGWFVYAMSGQGYKVNAEIMNITTQAAPVAATPAPAPPKGGGSNAGAIAGGVVGGLAGLALVALLAFFVLRHNKRAKRSQPMTTQSADSEDMKLKGLMSSPSIDGPKTIKEGGPFTMNTLYTPNEDGILSAPNNAGYMSSSLSDQDSYMSDAARSLDARSKATHTGTSAGASVGGMSDIDRLQQRRSKRQQSVSSGSSSDASMQSLLGSLEGLHAGSIFYDRYVLERGARRGSHTALVFGHDKDKPTEEVAIKFFPGESLGRFHHEKLFFENRGALEPGTADAHVERLLGNFQAHRSPITEESVPPCLVYERGSYTLQEWLNGAAKLAGRPEDADRVAALRDVLLAADYMHQRRLAHRSLTLRALMWFPQEQRWKLTSLAGWARAGERCSMEQYDVRYAAPELLLADLHGEEDIVASEAADLWAVGAIAFEVLSGSPLYPRHMREHDISGALLGVDGYRLPWEENAQYFSDALSPQACAFVQDLLVRSPKGRRPLSTALHSPLFGKLA